MSTLSNYFLTTMALLAAQLPSGRWGIFNKDKRLLFTVGSQETLDTILVQLSQRQIQVQRLAKP
ncbi:MAG: hypothetical protein AAF959_00115 [Cyanobacteria bacterium P01_D01_bin.56]